MNGIEKYKTLMMVIISGCIISAQAIDKKDPLGKGDHALLMDGGFESAALPVLSSSEPGRWGYFIHGKSDARLDVVADKGRNGSKAVRYIRTTEGSDNFHLDQVVPVERHANYELSAWVRAEGKLNPVLSVMTMKWRVLAAAPSNAGNGWTKVTLIFNSAENEFVRVEWFPGAKGKLYEGGAGTSWLDDICIRRLEQVPPAVQRALELTHSRIGEEIDPARVKTCEIGNPRPLRPITCRNGVLLYPDGSEVALWGVNFQTALSWEYNVRLKKCAVPLEVESLKKITDCNLDQLVRMRSNMIRMHLLPSDFTDATGNVCDSIFLDVLDYTIAACRERGIYVYLTLVNEMNSAFLKDSFMAGRDRREWITDPVLVDKTELYIRTMLTRRNRYTKVLYSEDPTIAVFEISNEPGYVDYITLAAEPMFAPCRKAFESWCRERGLTDHFNLHYYTFRYERVRAYINRMCLAIRSTGSTKPVVWNLNWPRMVQEHQDVFQAAADSTADAVSFCLYSGQHDVKQPYWMNPADLSARNYLPFLDENYAEYHRLRWALGQQFAKKAKLVYEYETFFNQSSYLYPVMARLFRSLGVQAANMWTYSLSPAAEYMSGSHLLNLYCTPHKAVSFTIAGELFANTPRYTPFTLIGEECRILGPCAVSFTNDVSLYQTGDLYLQSRTTAWQPVPPNLKVRHVVACGSSPQVTYEGTGAYTVDIGSTAVEIEINPDSEFVLPHWNSRHKGYPEKVCRLDSTSPHCFVLHHPEWQSGVRILRVENGHALPVESRNGKPAFDALPGHYRMEKIHP